MKKNHRLVSVVVTVSVPDVAALEDAGFLLKQAGEAVGLDVVHTASVEGHLPVPGDTVLHGRRPQPWIVRAVGQETAAITDLSGRTLEAPLRWLSPDPITAIDTDDPLS